MSRLRSRAAELRDEVERERYFDEGLVDARRRRQFEQLTEQYRDGALLRQAFTEWAGIAGVRSYYEPEGETVTFDPLAFSSASMRNAHFESFPNMEEALRRSRHKRNLQVRGTFNRDIAVRREDLVFFAPGNDLWTDAIIDNAIVADRGRACAIGRRASGAAFAALREGFDLLYTVSVDPRPLFAQGLDPVNLLRAQGFQPKPSSGFL